MAPNPARQQAVVFLGDGESTYNPLTEDDRIALGSRMDRDDIGFFAVPLGIKVNAHNLHGLASLTGGTVVRVQEDLGNVNRRAEFLARLKTALDVPVVKVETAKFGDEVGEVYPTRLPPLRADKSTLVVGKLARPAATTVSLKLNGLVAGRQGRTRPLARPARAAARSLLPEPDARPVARRPAQGRAGHASVGPGAGAGQHADRSSTATSSSSRRPGPSRSTAGTTRPSSTRPPSGSTPTTAKPRPGSPSSRNSRAARSPATTCEQKIAAKSDALKVTADAVAREVIQNVAAQDPKAQPAQQPTPGVNPQDVLREAAERRRIEEQRTRVLVDTTIRRARQLLRTDPDSAYADLKRQRDDIAGHDGIGNAARTQMVADLEAVMREIFIKGAEIKRQAEAERQAIAKTRQRLERVRPAGRG